MPWLHPEALEKRICIKKMAIVRLENRLNTLLESMKYPVSVLEDAECFEDMKIKKIAY
jgi:hypothetical protein